MSNEEIVSHLADFKHVITMRATDVLPNALKIAYSVGVGANECLGNAYKVGDKAKAKVIEGLVLVCVDGKPHGVFGHCWNKIDGVHFDPTLDFTQPEHVKTIPGEKSFKYFEGAESSPRKYYKKAKDKNLSWFTDSLGFGRILNGLGSEKLSELFYY